jgi:hypothetical protein
MSFQWVFDNAASISINNRSVVGQTITRNLRVRAVSRGTGVRRFTVQLPDGPAWSDIATDIQALEALDRFTTGTIKINAAGYRDWIDYGNIDKDETITVICVEFPEWTIFSRDQVSWSGPFVFYEVLA